MTKFQCPVEGCGKVLSKLQVMHFRASHDCDPVEWVEQQYSSEIQDKYTYGWGCYAIAEEYEWLSSDMVDEIVDTRTHRESVTGENNPMKRHEVADQFAGETNPAKRQAVREKIRQANTGRTMSEEAKRKISIKNTGNEISKDHRKAISESSSNMDRSYMQTDMYSQALSESLKGREPTYPSPYEVDELSHKVRSSWEEEIGRLLVQQGIQYDYELEFELSIGSYYPDFVVETCIIEVKGWSNERSIRKAERFTSEFPSYTYIVVGEKIPCDIHIPWDRRDELLELIDDE
ncbi:PDDEXK family nuclease [Halorussus litoreus]|uniref:NUMOD3 domain-containing DNA-binding protein n=1 Tax=Halorussus litoreus TaxID=1710536 RepID=UPI000E2333B6|nr:NUMOD3 domain-containing DNA-binding protein [Halorussus litoreus]